MEYEQLESSDEDCVVIHHSVKGIECSSNNNNDVGLTKMYCIDNEPVNGLHCDSIEQRCESLTDHKLFGSMQACNETESMAQESFTVSNYDPIIKSTSFNSEETLHENHDLQQVTELKEKSFHHENTSCFRKNNSFPLFNHCDPPRIPLLMSSADSGQQNQHGKRLLPPIKNVAFKKYRTLSDTFIVVNNDVKKENVLPVIHGSPVKIVAKDPDDDVRFQIGDDELSDQEAFDTSTSSDQDVVSSTSSSGDELGEIENNTSNISENLQTKLFQVLKLEELRCRSPTSSVHSAPIYSNEKGTSLSDDEDNKSVASDSKVITSRANSGKKRRPVSRHLSTPEQLIVGQSSMAEKTQDETLSPRSALGEELSDYTDDDDEVSESPSTRSTGILPAISSDGVRERNFLVGNLTKHGSLLGADELNRYFPDRMLRLFVGTWNMQRKGVPRNLNDFLLPKHEDYLQDMYVIGVQEATQDLKKWEVKLQETLGLTHVLAHSVTHGVLHMSVFVRRDLIWFCSLFEDDRVTTRMVSAIKTKGAVAIAFQFFGTSMIFITSHFHSGETRIKERVEDYNRIKEKIKLPKRLKWDSYKGSPNDVTTRFDCTFWCGDLNFRISQPHQIMHLEINNPDKYNFKEVLKGDQLTATKKRGQIFNGFTEPKIRFLPTYKFIPGTTQYDTSPKWRVPSYTDRILYKCKEGSVITCNRYDSVTTLKKSDHRPVYGLFEVCLKPGRDSCTLGGGKFRNDVYEKAARIRAEQGNLQNNSAVCNIL